MGVKPISTQTLQRLPLYLNYLRAQEKNGTVNVSATTIAGVLNLNDVQVRKDLASVSSGGRPKVGYVTKELIKELEHFLGYDNTESAVLVGVGNLGRALLSYNGFSEHGLDIVVAFDVNESVIGTNMNGKQVLSIDKMKDLCKRMKIRLGIICVPESEAQNVCDAFVECGVLAILNYAHVRLHVPDNVLVQNENMAYSLAVLSKHLTEKLNYNQPTGGNPNE